MSSSGKMPKKIRCAFVCSAVLVVFLLGATAAFGATVVPAASITPVAATNQITLSWTAVSGSSAYDVWRSTDPSGAGATCIGVVNATSTPTYTDQTASAGTTYYYAVRAVTSSDTASDRGVSGLLWSSPVKIAVDWTDNGSPHKGARFTDTSVKGCSTCHSIHSSGKDPVMLMEPATTGKEHIVVNKNCLSCHSESAAPGKDSVAQLTKTKGSGHSIQTTTTPDSTMTCANCHNPHADSSTSPNILAKSVRVGTKTKEVGTGDNAFCYACHDDAQTWYTQTTGKAYPTTYVRETSTANLGYFDYPMSGTYPGETVYKASGHANIKASDNRSKGDCLYCHAAHRSDQPYDDLTDTYRATKPVKNDPSRADTLDAASGDYAALCLKCHDGNDTYYDSTSTATPHVDIKTAVTESSGYEGHRILSWTATVPRDGKVPCFTCHDVHGSANNNAADLSGDLGKNITQEDLQRNVCFACHTSSDNKIWDQTSSSMVELTSANNSKVLGMNRTGVDVNAQFPKGIDNELATEDFGYEFNGIEVHSSASNVPCTLCHEDIHNPNPQVDYTYDQPSFAGYVTYGASGSITIHDSRLYPEENSSTQRIQTYAIQYSESPTFTIAVFTTPEKQASSITPDSDGGRSFDTTITGLSPDTDYYYRVVTTGTQGSGQGIVTHNSAQKAFHVPAAQ